MAPGSLATSLHVNGSTLSVMQCKSCPGNFSAVLSPVSPCFLNKVDAANDDTLGLQLERILNDTIVRQWDLYLSREENRCRKNQHDS